MLGEQGLYSVGIVPVFGLPCGECRVVLDGALLLCTDGQFIGKNNDQCIYLRR